MALKRNILANYAGQLVASLTAMLLVPVYVRILGVESYALVGMFAVVQSWMALLDMGLGPTLSREMARFGAGRLPVTPLRDLMRSLEWLYAVIAIAIAVALTLAAGDIARSWLKAGAANAGDVASGVTLLGVVVALRFGEGLYRSGLAGLQQQVFVNAVSVVVSLVRGFGAVAVLLWVEPTLRAFFVWQGVVSLASLLLLALRLKQLLPPGERRARFSAAALGEVRDFAGGAFAVSLLATVLIQGDKLLLSRLLPMEGLGYYLLASTIAGVLWLVGGPVVLAVTPALVTRIESQDIDGAIHDYTRAAELVAVLVGPASLVLALFPAGALLAWSGDAMVAARSGPLLALLAVGTGLSALVQVPQALSMAAGQPARPVWLMTLAGGVMLAAMGWLVPRHGAMAAAAIWVAVNLVYALALPLVQHRRLLPEAMMPLARATLAPVAGAAAPLVPAALLLDGVVMGRWAWLGMLAGLGLLAVGGALLAAPNTRRQLLRR